MEFTTRFSKLNAAQKEAVTTIDGPVMVIAGPGTGKTELLGMRAANILLKTDTLAENILCLTFTDSGAAAMRERLTQIIGADAYKVAIHTFHSFGSEIINQNSEFFYQGANFRPADELSCYEILRTIFDELDYNSPLASKLNGEYTHLQDTLTVISELKKSGLVSAELLQILDTNDEVIAKIEPLLADVFSQKINKTTATHLEPVIKKAHAATLPMSLPGITSLAQLIADSLEEAVQAAHETQSTKPITAWKNTWLKKDGNNALILKTRERQAKLRAVSYIYDRYIARMQAEQLYDFDDMILQVVHAMEVYPDLRFNLQEKYLYIMVDEFQDTNLAQMRILYNLTNNDVSAGQPNILVVGDDDQAIYSFQGADVGNIHSFNDLYQPKIIPLIDNYRSSETILQKARDVITLGSHRLENHLPNLDKTLTPHASTDIDKVDLVELASQNDERFWIAQTIAEAIARGTPPNTIAVIARRHAELVALLPYLLQKGIPVNYERRDNVLDLEVIKLIEHIAHIVVALFESRHSDANALLPELLAHPAFAITPTDIWRLSLAAHQHHESWLKTMATDPGFLALHEWFINLAQELAHTPLEVMLDRIIGLPEEQRSDDSEFHDNGTEEPASSKATTFTSPLFDYFFSADKLASQPDSYLQYLAALRTIRTHLQNYLPHESPHLRSFLEFIRLHRQLGSQITSIRPGSDHADNAINLLTAHKSKGLEFVTVYIIGGTDTTWGEHARHRVRLISYPENLPLAPVGDTIDERLRLFFVAMTRARSQLTISYGTSDDSGKQLLRARFLVGDTWQTTTIPPDDTLEKLTTIAELAWYQPLVQTAPHDLRTLLKPILENYKLSHTHLTNFLDVSRGGPPLFLLNNLLHFPQAPLPAAAYGSAIHASLQQAHTHLVATGEHRPLEDVLHDFENNLLGYHLTEREHTSYLQQGSDTLSTFLTTSRHLFTPTQKTELSFANQSVIVGKAHLTGFLDVVDIADGSVSVIDYKTGKTFRSWTGKTDADKIRLHKYRQQLMFYHLLLSHSRDYAKFAIQTTMLQFVEPTTGGDILPPLEATFSSEELHAFQRLIEIVWQHMMSLDLPDTSQYDPTYKGILAFEADLLSGSV